uniref:Uncharacterized protein n=1 Tax=uncultured marine virus TaxID=186617 RepID=A0A0F7L9C6_9VIRU|nr:hypothetical protein [uncultured marine virus]
MFDVIPNPRPLLSSATTSVIFPSKGQVIHCPSPARRSNPLCPFMLLYKLLLPAGHGASFVRGTLLTTFPSSVMQTLLSPKPWLIWCGFTTRNRNG